MASYDTYIRQQLYYAIHTEADTQRWPKLCYRTGELDRAATDNTSHLHCYREVDRHVRGGLLQCLYKLILYKLI